MIKVMVPKNATFDDIAALPLAWLQAAKTLAVGQASDLKLDTGRYRVWTSRMRPGDYPGCEAQWGRERKEVEQLIDGRWVLLDAYGRAVAP